MWPTTALCTKSQSECVWVWPLERCSFPRWTSLNQQVGGPYPTCNGLCCCLILPTAICVINPKDPWRNDLQGRKDISSSVFCETDFLFFILTVKICVHLIWISSFLPWTLPWVLIVENLGPREEIELIKSRRSRFTLSLPRSELLFWAFLDTALSSVTLAVSVQ